MDTLSDVLRAVRLTGAVFFEIRASEPWVAETPEGATIVGSIFPAAEHVIPYHVVTHGGCWAWALGDAPVRLTAGDIVVFPHGDAHVLSSAPGMRGTPDLALYHRPKDRSLPFRVTAGEAASWAAQIVCGYLGCDARPFNPLLAALPRVLHTSGGDGPLGTLFGFALAEARDAKAGSESVLRLLSELMFVEVVRSYVRTLPPEQTGWLAALRDPVVAAALTAIHADPARAWTVAALAREVGASRSVLAERFTRLVGDPPMQYVAQWRMQVAAHQLLSTLDTVAAVAERVGYESEAAFTRAFKKIVGTAPTPWRRRRGSLPDDGPGRNEAIAARRES